MSNVIYYTDFKTLREAYFEVKRFIEVETGANVSNLNTKIENDLCISGDDVLELLEKFVKKYKLNAEKFKYSKHFMSEEELFDSGAAFLKIIVLPISLIAFIIRIISLNKLDLKIDRLFTFWMRETCDLSIGDLIIWFLTGSFNLRSQIKVVI